MLLTFLQKLFMYEGKSKIIRTFDITYLKTRVRIFSFTLLHITTVWTLKLAMHTRRLNLVDFTFTVCYKKKRENSFTDRESCINFVLSIELPNVIHFLCFLLQWETTISKNERKTAKLPWNSVAIGLIVRFLTSYRQIRTD